MTSAAGEIIAREQWPALFEELTRDYRGRPATVELRPSGADAELIAVDEPLAAIVVADDGAIRVELLRQSGVTIDGPMRVRAAPFAVGAGRIIVVESVSGPEVQLYLAQEAGRSSGQGEIYGGAARAVGAGDERDDAPLGGSAGAAGGSVAGAAGTDDDASDGLVSFGGSDDMGGVASIGGGSLGDRDLTGRQTYDITDDVYGDLPPEVGDAAMGAGEASVTRGMPQSDVRGSGVGHTIGGDADVIDPGGDQGVIDQGRDPIAGSPLVPANDERDPYVEGEVGAQAEWRTQRELRRAQAADERDAGGAAQPAAERRGQQARSGRPTRGEKRRSKRKS